MKSITTSKLSVLSLLLAAAALLAACGGAGSGEDVQLTPAPGARPFEMGLSSLPQEPTEAGYQEVFEQAGKNG